MDDLIIILSYILGVTALALFIIACVFCIKIVKIYGFTSKKKKAVALPVALATFSAFNLGLLLFLIIENIALLCLVLFFIHEHKIALAYANAAKEPAPVIIPAPVAVPQPTPVVEASNVIEHRATEEEEQIVAEHIVEAITVEEAHNAVSDEVASHFIDKIKSDKTRFQKKSIINIDTLSENFEPGDSVNLESLIAKGLIHKNSDYVKVLARGHLNKKLCVEANDYSADAVKMIILTGGTVTEII